MDSKQYTGLGQYLSEIDPQHRDVTWHLQHIIIFCRVHFQRSILKTIGTTNQGSSLWSRMMSLLDCKSEADYDTLLDLLIKYEDVNVQNWAKQKKSTIIKAGLNKACSKIQPYYFDILRNHTNAVEQSHQESYASGKYLTLVEAVKKSTRSSHDLRRVASANAMSLEQRRQELELRKLEAEIKQKEADIRKQEEEIRLQQLENERLELDLMERRIRIQELQQSD
ncbi:uncharacterized protein NFIA_036080 [Aspergillus fischeri NRRL 181]|uniref:Uncharacterized protein n=1 Tax=Neosartorya fischeri (strain ATCC 1020 / DSM 3700 / CBS 544.65 / FGSC A1164 / JCM 1740 / NRRL 181 / WB 181) TaxID=331117 RepID=A1CZ66_NEOFI|nr:uncharacterized protein NFIA_036080 [Aspergillus fischeri NRRL 181]EAW24036.1 hypothetical protein NFIA_036080 [Aspergillus fischeri NRRL 181]